MQKKLINFLLKTGVEAVKTIRQKIKTLDMVNCAFLQRQ